MLNSGGQAHFWLTRVILIVMGMIVIVTAMAAGNRIIALSAPWVTPQDAPRSKVAAFDPAVQLKRFHCIGRACRLIPAAVSDPRAQEQAIGPHRQRYGKGERAHPWTRPSAQIRSCCIWAKSWVAVTSRRPTST